MKEDTIESRIFDALTECIRNRRAYVIFSADPVTQAFVQVAPGYEIGGHSVVSLRCEAAANQFLTGAEIDTGGELVLKNLGWNMPIGESDPNWWQDHDIASPADSGIVTRTVATLLSRTLRDVYGFNGSELAEVIIADFSIWDNTR